MASGELPKWGDGSVLPRMTDPKEWPYPTIAAEAFDPAVREGLVAFFQKALHRDAGQRYAELKPMRDAWRKVFLDASRTVPSSHRSRHPAASAPVTRHPPAAPPPSSLTPNRGPPSSSATGSPPRPPRTPR